MLVVLPHGACVDPEIVKMVVIRTERKGPTSPPIFTVAMKTDADDAFHVLAAFDNREEAEALSLECAQRINKGLGVGSDEDDDDEFDIAEDEGGDEAAGSTFDDDDDW